MAVREPKVRLLVILVFVLGAVGSLAWYLVKPSGFALLATIFLSVQAALLYYMSRLSTKLRK
jgi:hypothetical protein